MNSLQVAPAAPTVVQATPVPMGEDRARTPELIVVDAGTRDEGPETALIATGSLVEREPILWLTVLLPLGFCAIMGAVLYGVFFADAIYDRRSRR